MKTPEDAVSASPAPAVLEKPHRAEIWRQISEAAMSDQEQLILRESLIYALPPRAIHARHPDLFAEVAEVYRIKRNLFERLQHDRELRYLCLEGMLSA